MASQFIVVLTSYTASFLIAVVGLILCMAKRPRSRGLIATAMVIFLVKVIIGAVWQLAFVPYMMANSGGGPAMTMGFSLYAIVDQIMLVAVWVLVLIALFKRDDSAPASPAPYYASGGPAPGQPWGRPQPGAQPGAPAPGQDYGPPPGAAPGFGASPGPQYGPGQGPPAGQDHGTGPRPAPGQDYGQPSGRHGYGPGPESGRS